MSNEEKKGALRPKYGNNSGRGDLYIKTIERRGGGSDREPTHLDSNQSVFPNSRRRGRGTIGGVPGAYVVETHDYNYGNDGQGWHEV